MGRKVGNILANRRPPGFGPQFNLIHNIDEADKSVPTLIIGLDEATKLIPDFSVLNENYDDGMLWWAFAKTERRSEHEDTVQRFRSHALKLALSGIRYEYVDFICYSLDRVKSFIRFMDSPKRKTVFVTREGRFAFIYCADYSVVWGLSLTLCDYIGVNHKKVISRIRSNPSNEIIADTSFMDSAMRRMVGDDTHYIAPLYNIML